LFTKVVATALAIRAAPRAVSSVAATLMMLALGSTDELTVFSSVAAVSPGTFLAARRSVSRVVSRASIVARRRSTDSTSPVWSGSDAPPTTIFAVA
jgi:hypothetical protein